MESDDRPLIMSNNDEQRRHHMVDRQIAARGISDPQVLEAMRTVPRELFVPGAEQPYAYDDAPLPIGAGQTISQPYIVAYMIEALQLDKTDKVLEIGAGSGYAAAVLAEIVTHVYAIERIPDLAAMAAANLERAGYRNVEIRNADGTLGWPEAAPFDAILVSAGAPEKPKVLMDQLTAGGRMIVPVGRHPSEQRLIRITRRGPTEFTEERLTHVRFVPLIGAAAWTDGNAP
jgi:protein-L-isoaspartate(D-aspartate) O-methyltransferase